MNNLEAFRGTLAAEQATGCRGASGYYDFAMKKGYKHVEVYDWSSSAGDWTFLISKDDKKWQFLFQTNNYPRPGFSYEISKEVFFGSFDAVLRQITELYPA